MEPRRVFADSHGTPSDPVYWVKAFNFFLTHATGQPTVTITYAFQESGQTGFGENLRAMSQAEKDNVLDAIAKVTANIGLNLVPGDIATAKIVFGISDDPDQSASGITFTGGQIQVIAYDRHAPGNDVSQNEYIFKHELLHALGLDHSTALFGGTGPVLIPATEDDGTTLFGNWSPYWANDIQLFDLAALQFMYGPRPTARAGDDTYVISGGAFDPDNPDLNPTLIWDGAGYDTIDLSGLGVPVAATLTPGEISRINGAAGGILEAGTFSINYRTQIERLIGGAFNDALSGDDHNNNLVGDDGDDTLSGDDGADILAGGAGADSLDGGSGTDASDYSGAAGAVAVDLAAGLGSAGDAAGDTLTGVEDVDGSGFDDAITGNGVANRLAGLAGADTLSGAAGDDTLRGEDGDDDLFGGFGKDRAEGGAGDDLIRSGPDNDTLLGGDGNDTLGASNRTDLLRGEAGDDFLLGSNGNDRLFGGADADTLLGGNGRDTLSGDSGADRLVGGNQVDVASYETAAAGVAVSLAAGAGTAGDAAGDVLIEIESLRGSNFNDTLEGDSGANRLDGFSGADNLDGGGGADIIVGGDGADTMTGGAGDDRFWFFNGAGADIVTDFVAGAGSDDVIRLFGRGASVDSFAEVMALASQQGANVVINFGGGDQITLQNVMLGALHADDFQFG